MFYYRDFHHHASCTYIWVLAMLRVQQVYTIIMCYKFNYSHLCSHEVFGFCSLRKAMHGIHNPPPFSPPHPLLSFLLFLILLSDMALFPKTATICGIQRSYINIVECELPCASRVHMYHLHHVEIRCAQGSRLRSRHRYRSVSFLFPIDC